jgi:hypothetical protein
MVEPEDHYEDMDVFYTDSIIDFATEEDWALAMLNFDYQFDAPQLSRFKRFWCWVVTRHERAQTTSSRYFDEGTVRGSVSHTWCDLCGQKVTA